MKWFCIDANLTTKMLAACIVSELTKITTSRLPFFRKTEKQRLAMHTLVTSAHRRWAREFSNSRPLCFRNRNGKLVWRKVARTRVTRLIWTITWIICHGGSGHMAEIKKLHRQTSHTGVIGGETNATATCHGIHSRIGDRQLLLRRIGTSLVCKKLGELMQPSIDGGSE